MFDLNEQTVKYANYNPKTELNGDKRKPVTYLSINALMSSSILDDFYPGLRAMLYQATKNPDLAEQAAPEELTQLRMPLLALPLDWELELANRQLTIHYGLDDAKSRIVLPECKISKFKFTPQNGGTVVVQFLITAHPDKKHADFFYDNQETDIVISIEAVEPAETQGNLLPAEPKKSKKQLQAEAKAQLEATFKDGSESVDETETAE